MVEEYIIAFESLDDPTVYLEAVYLHHGELEIDTNPDIDSALELTLVEALFLQARIEDKKLSIADVISIEYYYPDY